MHRGLGRSSFTNCNTPASPAGGSLKPRLHHGFGGWLVVCCHILLLRPLASCHFQPPPHLCFQCSLSLLCSCVSLIPPPHTHTCLTSALMALPCFQCLSTCTSLVQFVLNLCLSLSLLVFCFVSECLSTLLVFPVLVFLDSCPCSPRFQFVSGFAFVFLLFKKKKYKICIASYQSVNANQFLTGHKI